ncbi:hypothetical protein [Desulfovibrio sp. TomC]|uniref:hypothetical protein n=1 Tax=Desulfovibrio sp. TomC TaxID=1562888 RepID=UPI00057443A5|nr:hypothetical protein [Desulfovibrio sp. TomC]KHK03894.1 hypothetical protein NY78_0950 [Desulfovibrio sp. TomC]
MQITSYSGNISSLLTLSGQTTAQGTEQSASATSGHASLTFGNGDDKTTATIKAPSSTSEVFASEIMRRISLAETPTTASNAGTGVNFGAAGDLQTSLADAVESVRQSHGDAAATAVMGIVIKGVGDGSGGEDALGDALVSALKFIDRNFGVAAGDAAMANFNGALNNSINDFYQNGHLEEFYASDGSSGTGSAIKQAQGVVSSTLAHVAKQYGVDAAQTIADILDTNFTQTGSTREGLGKAIAAADAYLTENYGAGDLGDLPLGQETALPKGSVLSLSV